MLKEHNWHDADRVEPITSKITRLNRTFSIKNLTLTCLGINSGLHAEIPMTNSLSQGTTSSANNKKVSNEYVRNAAEEKMILRNFII
jgi:hypothetical protein